MTIDDVRILWNKGHYNNALDYKKYHEPLYREMHTFDAAKSVEWNCEETARVNAQRRELREKYHDENTKCYDMFKNDLISAIIAEGFNKAQATVIFEYVYQEYHSSIYDVFIYLGEITDLIKRVNEYAN